MLTISNVITDVNRYCSSGICVPKFAIKTPRVLALARKYFNCASLEGVDLEN